ncbi:MAG TPA: anti-sigma factor [Acetobacteraceae bacterium]
MIPGDPASRDALAGEYVLGTLDAQAAAAVQAAMATDPALRAAVEAWEARLGPLARLAPPEAPPPDLWHRIEARIAPAAPARLARRIGFWRGWAIGASLAAAGFAALAVLPRGPGPAEGQGGVPSLAGADRTGVVSLADGDSTSGVVVDQSADGTVMELWAVPPGAPGPVSLGVLRRGGGRLSIPATAVQPAAGTLIQITLEPRGGSPTGAPTGPVLFSGRWNEAPP